MTQPVTPLKIVMLGVRGIPASSGGTEWVVEELARRMAAAGHDVTVYCRAHYVPRTLTRCHGVRLRFAPCINTKHLEAISHTFFSTLLIVFSQYDIVHFHSIGPSIMSWLPRFRGMGVVSTSHGLDWQRKKWGPVGRFFLRLGERASAFFPHRTTVVSTFLQTYYKSKYTGDFSYIPNGITLPALTDDQSELQKFNLSKDGYILFLSRIVPEKGLDYLISAYQRLETDMPLVIAGEPTHTEPYCESLKAACQADSRIRFIGAVYGESKNQLFQHAFCFVLPSELEGMPIVLLEALANQCVPIVSDVPVNQSIVQPGNAVYGYVFKSGDVDSLCTALSEVLENPSLITALRPKLRAYAQTQFNWEEIVARYLQLYSAIKKRGLEG